MRTISFAALFMTLCSGVTVAQTVPTPAAPVQAGKLPSAILQPATANVRSALDKVRLDKWKASSAVKDETDSNIGSIRRDLDNTLPGLLAAADAAPNSVSKVMPAYRNVEALYDVLLRVDAAARSFAAGDQSAMLDQALTGLDQARRDLGDRLQSAGMAQEKQVADLQASLKAAPTTPAVTPVCAPVAPPANNKKKPVAKPAAKPSTTTH